MCGITGIVRFGARRVERPEIERLTATLNHRGPDGSGIFISEDGHVALGHTRLAILDLTDKAAQPMTDMSGSLTIVFNGEIYNFLELRSALAKRGHAFRSDSDTEVLLAGFKEWREDLFERLNGMWAMLLWDSKKETLIASRDRFGVKPLFVQKLSNEMIFSSETKSFGDFLPRRNFDKRVISNSLSNTYYPLSKNLTIYDNCTSIEPGKIVKIRKNGVTETRTWWKIEDNIPECRADAPERLEEFRELFKDACRIRMRSDVRISTALSGGLDSSVTFAQCAEIVSASVGESNDRQISVAEPHTISLPNTGWDETEHASSVASMYGAKIHRVTPKAHEFLDNLIRNTKHFDNIWYLPDVTHTVYGAMRENGYKISMDGHGADEVFFGYPDMIAAYSDSPNFDTIPSYSEWKNKLISGSRRLTSKFGRTPRQVWTSRLTNQPWVFRNAEPINRYKGRKLERDQEISVNEVCNFRLPTILRNFDQSSMLSGIEIRSPFLDWRVVVYGLSLPIFDKFDENQNKKIIRTAFRSRIPDTVLDRRDKIGINSPLENWILSRPSIFLDMVDDRSFIESDIWNGPVIRDYFHRIVRSGKISRYDICRVWPFLNAHILMN